MTSKAGHTAGPWRAYRDRTVVSRNKLIADCRANDSTTVDEADANARFIAETFTVAHETGLTPRQLAERCEKLEAALAFTYADPCFTLLGSVTKDEVSAAIAKATSGKLTDDEIVELTSREAALGPDKAGGA